MNTLTRLLNWFGIGKPPAAGADATARDRERSTRQPASGKAGAVRTPDPVPLRAAGRAPSGDNPLIRNKFLREDTGTHETLKILDDSIIDSGEEEGFDPYNTGDFDRSRNWERRFRD